MNDKLHGFTKNMLKIGTPECAVFFAVLAMVLALLFLAVGFWQTILIAVLALLGAFIGGVKDKKEWLRGAINRIFPPKQNVPYREKNEEIQRAVKEAQEKQAFQAAEVREEEQDKPETPDQE